MGYDLKLRVWRGDTSGGELGDYTVAVEEGATMVRLGTVLFDCEPPGADDLRSAAAGSRSQSSTVSGVVRTDAQRASSPCKRTVSSIHGFTRGRTVTTEKR